MTESEQQLEDIEKRLLNACKAAKDKQVEIHSGLWGAQFNDRTREWEQQQFPNGADVPDVPCCCPMGALLLAEQPLPDAGSDHYGTAAHALGVSTNWIDDFTAGFDSIFPDMDVHDVAHPEAFWLGNRFRRLYVGP